jgi:hypothetical protein
MSHVITAGLDEVPLMGTLEAKFQSKSELQQGVQFPKQKQKQREKPQQQLQQQNSHVEIKKKKKKKKKKKSIIEIVHVPLPQTPSASAKKKVSFSPRVVSTVAYTYSKQEYDRTPIMGIFNHFCDVCMEGIEGARFHCQLCANFDMCQSCFVSQGARHCHGQAAFSCPELDEIEDDEGDEDEGDFDGFNEYLASLAAQGEVDEDDEDTSLDGLAFRFANNSDFSPSSIHLADENGPLEQITSAEAAQLEVDEDTPIKLLFPKTPTSASGEAAKPKKSHKKKNSPRPPLPKQNWNLENKAESIPVPKKKAKKQTQTLVTPQPPQHASSVATLLPKSKKAHKDPTNLTNQPKVRKRKKPSAGAGKTTQPSLESLSTGFDEDEPLRIMLQKFSTAGSTPPSTPPKKKGSPNKANTLNPLKQQEDKTSTRQPLASVAASTSKKRIRADGSIPKVKKQKLLSSPKTDSNLKFSFGEDGST